MSNIYVRKSRWKWYLSVAALIIIAISMFYTRYLAKQLETRERQQAVMWAEAQRSIAKISSDTSECLNSDYTLPVRVLELNNTIPVIMVDRYGNVQDALNVAGVQEKKIVVEEVATALRRMRQDWIDSIEIAPKAFPDIYVKVYYSHSNLLTYIRWFPFVQLALIIGFIAFGYISFSAARRAEENQVWLGMAKETAHQLGTPITAILGWLETLRYSNEDRPDNLEMLQELGRDVNRLELVADRFSKIGSVPELALVNLYTELDECRAYMQRRAPRKVSIEFPKPEEHPPLMVELNAHLFDWVIENLMRNAIDAMEEGTGKIKATVHEEGKYVVIEITDSGKGIPSGKFKTVFKPGYSTKKRGWGLGLSLSRRIIEQYHQGKIFIKKSELGKGTTFCIKLLKK